MRGRPTTILRGKPVLDVVYPIPEFGDAIIRQEDLDGSIRLVLEGICWLSIRMEEEQGDFHPYASMELYALYHSVSSYASSDSFEPSELESRFGDVDLWTGFLERARGVHPPVQDSFLKATIVFVEDLVELLQLKKELSRFTCANCAKPPRMFYRNGRLEEVICSGCGRRLSPAAT